MFGREAVFWVWMAISVLVIVGQSGCRGAPDVRPFDAATASLATSLAGAGEVVATDIVRSTRAWPEAERAQGAAIAARLREQWAAREGLAEALRGYSATLVVIVERGERGERSARELAAALARLSAAVDLAIPPSEAGALGVRIGAAVYGAFARENAARELAGTMRGVAPAVDALVEVMDADLEALAEAVDALHAQCGADVDEERVDGLRPREERGAMRVLAARQGELRVRLGVIGAGTIAPDVNALTEAERSALRQELAEVEASLDLSLRRLAPLDARIAEERARLARDAELIETCRAALRAWAGAHARVVAALESDGPLRIEDLTRITEQLRIRISETSSHTLADGGN